MAGSSVDEALEEANAPKKSRKGLIIFIIVFVVLLAISIAVFGFNVFGLRDSMQRALSDVPIIGKVLPVPEGGEEGEEKEDDPLGDITKEELAERVMELEEQLIIVDDELDAAEELNSMYTEEIARLQVFENEHAALKAEQEEFYRDIASEDEREFQEYFEKMNPAMAEEIYAQIVSEKAVSDEIKNYVNTFSNMDAGDAAEILEEVMIGELNLVVDILYRMDANSRGDILAEMDAENASAASKRLATKVPGYNPQG